jgi:glycosyltransferase involved in cell wall biosynthesis
MPSEERNVPAESRDMQPEGARAKEPILLGEMADGAPRTAGARSDAGTATRKRILIFAPSFYPAIRAGGPARSLTNLVDELASAHDVDVVTSDRDHGSTSPFPNLSGRTVHRGEARIHYWNTARRASYIRSIRTVAGQPFDIVLLNSIWSIPFSFIPATMRLVGMLRTSNLILMPRGELEPGALALESSKKATAMPVVRRVYRSAVDVFGATSDSEMENLARWNPGLPVLRVSVSPDAVPFGAPSEEASRLRLLFLGRIHPTKGLLPLLRALSGAPFDLELSIAGPVGDEEYWQECQAAIQLLDPLTQVRYIGEVSRVAAVHLLHEHDAVVSLTAGENFGHVFAEALQAGCPVVATPFTPWTSTLENGGGFVVLDRDDPREVAEVLGLLAAMSRAERAELRKSARSAYEQWREDRPGNVIDEFLAFERVRMGPS